ncbi:MAG: response regulator [Kofleriaceae bacterium]
MVDDAAILVVEDDRDIRDSLIDALEDEGYAVISAIDGVDALEQLRAGARPGLILLDLMMPRMSGSKFREELLKVPSWATIPFVVVSADPLATAKTATLGAAALLRKPIKLKELFEVVARFSPVARA